MNIIQSQFTFNACIYTKIIPDTFKERKEEENNQILGND